MPREAELAVLRDLLLGQQRQVAVTALRGMGGVGKTTLAIALCHDRQVIEAFLDGILFLRRYDPHDHRKNQCQRKRTQVIRPSLQEVPLLRKSRYGV